jgi:hypothetical protein
MRRSKTKRQLIDLKRYTFSTDVTFFPLCLQVGTSAEPHHHPVVKHIVQSDKNCYCMQQIWFGARPWYRAIATWSRDMDCSVNGLIAFALVRQRNRTRRPTWALTELLSLKSWDWHVVAKGRPFMLPLHLGSVPVC